MLDVSVWSVLDMAMVLGFTSLGRRKALRRLAVVDYRCVASTRGALYLVGVVLFYPVPWYLVVYC